MKKIFILASIVMLFLQNSCKNTKKEEDVYFYLTQEQKDFIATVHAGDTVIWESSSSLKDTAIIGPIIYDTYIIEDAANGQGAKIGERAYYLYRFLSTKRTKVADGICVKSVKDNSADKGWLLYNGIVNVAVAQGVFNLKKVGSTIYNNVYWNSPANAVADTVFFSDKGYLGYKKGSESLQKIK